MRQISFVIAAVFVGIFMLAGNANSAVFSLNDAALLQLWEVDEKPINGITNLYFATDDPLLYGGGGMFGSVGYVGRLYSSPNNPNPFFSSMQIGANSTGVSSTLGTTGATTAKVIGDSLGIAPTNSLVGFNTFAMAIGNDNDDKWMYSIYLHTGEGEVNMYHTEWVTLESHTSTVLSLDLTGAVELDNVTNIGVYIKANLTDSDGNPSNPDTFHFSLSPTVPEPDSLVLLGFGLLGLLGWGRFGFIRVKRRK